MSAIRVICEKCGQPKVVGVVGKQTFPAHTCAALSTNIFCAQCQYPAAGVHYPCCPTLRRGTE